MTYLRWLVLALLPVAAAGCSLPGDLDLAVDTGDPDDEDDRRPGTTATDVEGPAIVFALDTDSDAPRLNNFGKPAPMPQGHAGQSPRFHWIGAHYFELSPNAFTWVGQGEVLYHSPDTFAAGELAVDFDLEPIGEPGEDVVAVAVSDIAPGIYEYLRVAVSYQEYDVDLEADFAGQTVDVVGRVASFVEENTFIREFDLAGETVTVNDNRKQGYWAFTTPYTGVIEGQAPEGTTTVPNPIDATSPIGLTSCIVTGQFDEPLVITGDEHDDINVTVTFSTSKSFEWIDSNGDGRWQPLAGEAVVDMGVRGMTLTVD